MSLIKAKNLITTNDRELNLVCKYSLLELSEEECARVATILVTDERVKKFKETHKLKVQLHENRTVLMISKPFEEGNSLTFFEDLTEGLINRINSVL